MLVLVVVDDAAVREMISAVLQRNGFDAVALPHGDAAVEAIERSGDEYAAAVVQVNARPSRIDTAARTGVALLDHMQRASPALVARTVVATTIPRLQVPACATIVQPFEIDELIAAVRRCVQRG